MNTRFGNRGYYTKPTMEGFSGFPNGKLKLTSVPNLFFSDLLPLIDTVEELKVTLYAMWALNRKEGKIRYMRLVDFLNDPIFMGGMGANATEAARAVERGLESAVSRGIFLHLSIESASGAAELYFVNSEKGRAAVEGIEKGEWRPTPDDSEPISLLVERPNIFVLYEQNIGRLTPMLADELRDAEKTYPMAWIEEAIQMSVTNNVRKWRYILAILERWRQDGKQDGHGRRDSQKELKQQIPDEYKDIINR